MKITLDQIMRQKFHIERETTKKLSKILQQTTSSYHDVIT